MSVIIEGTLSAKDLADLIVIVENDESVSRAIVFALQLQAAGLTDRGATAAYLKAFIKVGNN